MGFVFAVPIRLRISEIAYATLIQDIYDFQNSPDKEKVSSFLNSIIEKFYYGSYNSETSIDAQSYAIRKKYSNWFGNDKSYKMLINSLVKKEQEEKLARIEKSYSMPPSGEGKEIRFKPNKAVRRILEKYHEDDFYTSPAKFLSAFIQEYTALPRVRRERIFFGDVFDEMEKCIDDSCYAEITLYNNETFFLRPYKIVPDIFSSWHYVFGYAHSEQSDESSETLLSFRMQRIHDVQMRQSFDFSTKETEKLSKVLHQPENIPFLRDEPVQGKVRLTQKGWELYQYYIRTNQPAFLEKIIEKGNTPEEDKIILTFECTEQQLEYYFIKFGADAEILAPPSLRKRFKEIHENALKYYMDHHLH